MLATLSLRLDTAVAGPHAETITLHPVGSNASGFLGVLPEVTLTVTDVVAAERKPAHGGQDEPRHHPPGHGHGQADHHRGHGHADQHRGHGHTMHHGSWADARAAC